MSAVCRDLNNQTKLKAALEVQDKASRHTPPFYCSDCPVSRRNFPHLEEVVTLRLRQVIGSDDPVFSDQTHWTQLRHFFGGFGHSETHAHRHTRTKTKSTVTAIVWLRSFV